MAGSSSEGTKTPEPELDSSMEDQCNAIAENTATTVTEEDKKSRKKMVRFTQQQIDCCIANG